MDDNILSLDADVLERTAEMIEKYATCQVNLMTDYYGVMRRLNDEWQDKSLDKLLEEIKRQCSKVSDMMEEICRLYPGYFRMKADSIRVKDAIEL